MAMNLKLVPKTEKILIEIMEEENYKTKSKAIAFVINEHQKLVHMNTSLEKSAQEYKERFEELAAHINQRALLSEKIEKIMISTNIPNQETLDSFNETDFESMSLNDFKDLC